jgi:hypothetical protein
LGHDVICLACLLLAWLACLLHAGLACPLHPGLACLPHAGLQGAETVARDRVWLGDWLSSSSTPDS